MLHKIEWVYCPICGNKTRNKIRKDTILKNYSLYCPKCRQETLIVKKRCYGGRYCYARKDFLTEYISPITVEVTKSLRFFFCRFLSECAARLVLVLAAVCRLFNLDFYIFKNSDWK